MKKNDATDLTMFVRTSQETIAHWDRNRIVDALVRETYVNIDTANTISREVEDLIKHSNISVITTPLIRELVDAKLIEHGLEKARIMHTRLGMPLYDVNQLIFNRNKENANVPHNPEATNLTLAENIKKEYALLNVFSQDVADAHMRGDIHIHDLGFCDRPYSFFRNEILIVKTPKDKIWVLPFEQLFEKITSEIKKEKEFEIKNTPGFFVADENGWVELKRIVRHKTEKPLITINSENGKTITTTSDHPFIKIKEDAKVIICPKCKSENVVKNGSIKKQKRSYLCKNCNRIFRIKIEEINVKDREIVSTEKINNRNFILTPKINCKNKNKSEIKEDMAYFIGYFIAEGFYGKNEVSIRTKEIELDKIKQILRNNKIKFGGNKERIRIYSKNFKDYLKDQLGIRRYSQNITLPFDFFEYNEKVINAMISGIIDGDGCIKTDKYVSEILIRLTSKALLSQMQTYFDSIGIRNYLTPIKDYGISIYKDKTIEGKLPLFCLRFYLTSKQKELFKFSEKINNKEFKETKVNREQKNYSQVKKIKEIKNDDPYVYDITTESGTFISSGVLVHNCSGQSLEYVKKYGLNLPNALSMAKPAKHPEVLLAHMVKFSAALQGHFAGAIGWDAVNLYFAPYITHMSSNEVRQLSQMLIFEYSQQAVARGGQAIFSDINLYWEVPSHLENVPAIGPGGEYTGKTYGAYEKDAQKFLWELFEVYKEGDGCGRPFFFPKPLLHITEKFFTTENHLEFLYHACDVASTKGNTYFVFDRGATAKISECCFHNTQKVLVKTSRGIRHDTIGKICRTYIKEIKVFHNGVFRKAKPVITKHDKFVKVTLSNGFKMFVTDNHLCPTYVGDKEAKFLTTNDFIPVNNIEFKGLNDKGTYFMGYFIGAYLGDGSCDHKGNNNGITFSLSKRKQKVINIITEFAKSFGAHITVRPENDKHIIFVKITSMTLKALILEFIGGENALTKTLNNRVYEMSISFKKGLTDGYFDTDGGSSKRIYTSSSNLIDDMATLNTTLGMPINITEDNRKKFEGSYSNNPNYCIRPYERVSKYKRRKGFIFENNKYYFQIKNIDYISYNKLIPAYCFEMEDNNNPYFTLANGIETHNCRLSFKLNTQDIAEAKTPWKMRYSALQNVSINLPRFGYEAQGDDTTLFSLLSDRVELVAKAHIQKKHFIEKLLAQGKNGPLALLVMDKDGEPYLRMNKLSYLVGMVGLNELVQAHTGQEMHESKSAFKFGLKVISHMKLMVDKLSSEYNMHFVLEQTPAESTSYRFAKLDIKHFSPDAGHIVKGNILEDEVYYTNSTYLNGSVPINPIERVKQEGLFHPLVEAGALTHIWVGESTPSKESLANFVIKTFKMTQNDQIAFSPEFTICNSCLKTSRGLHEKCPICSSPDVDGITRITGYFTKISSWNKGKIGELHDRFRLEI